MTDELINQTPELSVPDVAVVVVVSGEQQLSSQGEADRRNSAENFVVGVLVELIVSSDVEQTARRVITSRSKTRSRQEKIEPS